MSYDNIEDARAAITYAMVKDPDIAWAWHCVLAVNMQDEGVSHKVSNAGAARFMKQVFDVDTSVAPIPSEEEDDVIEFVD